MKKVSVETEAGVATYTGLGFASESSELQEEYQKFFRGKLAEFGIESPAELEDSQTAKFFDELKTGWADRKARLAESNG